MYETFVQIPRDDPTSARAFEVQWLTILRFVGLSGFRVVRVVVRYCSRNKLEERGET